tara:strand:+ start:2551 stop:3240 length:690 start_codon:yes stop_codon:yes gene_type:complete
MLYAGDIHGNTLAINQIDRVALEQGAPTVIQVGDFGARWSEHGCSVVEYFEANPEGPEWITCGGNHDNWDVWFSLAKEQGFPEKVQLAPRCFWATRNSTIVLEGQKHLFFGGAESADRHLRVEGKSWWERETPSYAEFTQFAAALDLEKPDIVVSHDAPKRVPVETDPARRVQVTPTNLDNVLRYSDHKPTWWLFGHHHQLEMWDIDEIHFVCCGLEGGLVSTTDLPSR